MSREVYYRTFRVGCWLILFGAVIHSRSLAQVSNPSNPHSTSNGQYVGTFTDPTTGRQFDRYLEQESVPVSKYEYMDATERKWIPHWVTENRKVTETQYVPIVEYQPRQRIVNRFNPFGQPQITWEYVPVTRYQTVNQAVERPMTYQKWVEEEVRVRIPKLVETTEAKAKYVDRERTASSVLPVNANATNPIQNAAQLAMANRNQPVASYVTRPMDRWYSGSSAPASMYPYAQPSMPTTTLVSNQAVAPPTSSAFFNPYPPVLPGNAYAVNQPWFQWPAWTNTNGPLLQRDLFMRSQTTPYSTPPYTSVANQNFVTGYLRPSTSQVMPQGQSAAWGNFGSNETYRDPAQVGLPPTVLR